MSKASNVIKLLESEKTYYYHITSSRNMEVIYNKGLTPSYDTNWGGILGDSSQGKVYLAKDRHHAEYYGEILKRNDEYPGIYYFMLRVKRSNLKGVMEDPEDTGSVFVTKSISPAVIEVEWGEHGWKKLKSIDYGDIKGVAGGEWDDETEG